MSARKTYDLRVVTEFSSAHVLRGYAGACEQVHGHNFRVEVVVRAHELDALGMGLDFRELLRMTEEITGELDHRLLNDVPPFDEVNPTAENLAAHIYRRLGRTLDDSAVAGRVRVHAVTVHENDRISARYRELD
ncbi:MAG: 6-carboxytetrahydropterin synthase QueD [Myxococcales bacterium]|nr:6-carboxytetrahydropterin synthase QueD [Myxococcales bacterium]MCB9715282.1 6-carboxytetrahydropterin synthase QueD [Myxococcales bacterium]